MVPSLVPRNRTDVGAALHPLEGRRDTSMTGTPVGSWRRMIMMKSTTLLAVLGLLVLMVPQSVVAQNQLFVGNWKVNIAKSTYNPGPPPKSQTLRFEAAGERIKVSLDGVNVQGPFHSEGTGKFDGVDVPVVATPARQAKFTYAFRRIDDHTWEIVIKVNGERRILVHNVVSADGKTMKGVSTAVTPQGQTTLEVVIYEKQ